MQTQRMLDEFKNEPFTDFSKAENAEAMKAAIGKIRSELGREYPCTINGEKITLASKFQSYNPAKKDEVVGVFSEVDTDTSLVGKAIDAATEAFKTWKFVPHAERAEYLFKAADIIRQRKHEFSAWMVLEVSKTWAEADGDTAEAIDFLEFYGREMLRWGQGAAGSANSGGTNPLDISRLGWCCNSAVDFPWRSWPEDNGSCRYGKYCCPEALVRSPTIAAKFIEVLDEIGLRRRCELSYGSSADGRSNDDEPED